MASCGGFHGPPATLGLVVGSVVGLGLHVDVETVLVRTAGYRPFQRRERCHWDAAEKSGGKQCKHPF